MSARKLLERLGKAALQPSLLNGRWKKAPISARVAAGLRRQELLAGREWPYDEEKAPAARGFGLRPKQPKGHKWEKEKAVRLADIEQNMKDMPEKIAAYRESRKLKEISPLDVLTSTPKERRLKQYRLPR